MFTRISAPVFLASAVLGDYNCPGSPAWVNHAKAQIQASFNDDCYTVHEEILARVQGVNNWKDFHNGGIYTVLQTKGTTEVDLSRLTGNKKYTDKLNLVLEDSNGGCVLYGCSESQVTSVADFSTNFCNIHDLYCGSADGCPHSMHDLDYTEDKVKVSLGAGSSKSDCLGNKTDASSPSIEEIVDQGNMNEASLTDEEIAQDKAEETVTLEQDKCCVGQCSDPKKAKYYSIAKGFDGTPHCGECCMNPSQFWEYKIFEPALQPSPEGEYSPCTQVFGYTEYDTTVTHGFGPIKMTLDLFNLPKTDAPVEIEEDEKAVI